MKKILITTLLLLSASGYASQVNVQALEACSLVESDLKRLMCYDNVMTDTKNNKLDKGSSSETSLASTSTSDKLDEFGMENNKEAAKEKLDAVHSSVTKITKDKLGKRTFTLQNNQVWKQQNTEFFTAKENDEITIIRGVFNSFRMKKVGTNRLIPVKRIK